MQITELPPLPECKLQDFDYSSYKGGNHVQIKYWESWRNGIGLQTVGSVWTVASVDPVAPVNCLFCPSPGTGDFQRVGSKVRVLGFNFRANISSPGFTDATGALNPRYARIVISRNRQCNGLQPNNNEILASNFNSVGMNYWQATDYLPKYDILYDKMLIFRYATTTWDPVGMHFDALGAMHVIDYQHIFEEPVIVHFNNSVFPQGTVDSIIDNSFHMMAGVNALISINMSYAFRWAYVDV